MKENEDQEKKFRSNQEVYKDGKALFLDVEPDDDKHLVEQLDVLLEVNPKGTNTADGNLLVVIANGSEELCNIKANYVNELIERHLDKKGRNDLIDKINIKIAPDETLSLSSGKINYWESLDSASRSQDKMYETYKADDITNRTVSMCAEVHGVKGLEKAKIIYIMPGFNFKMLLPKDPDQLQQLKDKIVVFDQITQAGVSVNQQDLSSDNHKQLSKLYEVSLDESGKVKTTGITDTAASSVKWNQVYLIPNQIGDGVKQNGVVTINDKKTGENKEIKGYLKDDISGSKLIEVLSSAYKIDASDNSEFNASYQNNESFQAIKEKNHVSGEDIYNTLKYLSFYAHENKVKLPTKNDVLINLMQNNLVTYNEDADNKTSFFLQREVDFTVGAGLYMDMIATNADFNLGLIPEMIAQEKLEVGKHFETAEKVHKMCPFFTPTQEGTLPVKEKGGKRKADFGSKQKDEQPELLVVKLTEEGNKVLQASAVEKLLSNIDQTREYPQQVNPDLMPNPSGPDELVVRVKEISNSTPSKMEAFAKVITPKRQGASMAERPLKTQGDTKRPLKTQGDTKRLKKGYGPS